MPTTNTAHLDLDRIDLRILRLVLILSNTQSLTKTAAAMKLSVSQASRLLADGRESYFRNRNFQSAWPADGAVSPASGAAAAPAQCF